MKENVSCKDCLWFDKNTKCCSINNDSSFRINKICFYINEDYSIANFGLHSFYYHHDLDPPKKVKCDNCKYCIRRDFCGLDQKYYYGSENFECMYVNDDYSITKKGKKKLLEENI